MTEMKRKVGEKDVCGAAAWGRRAVWSRREKGLVGGLHFRALASALFVLVSSFACAATWTGADGVELEYEVSGDGTAITGCALSGSFRGRLEIPAELGPHPVRCIGDSAFSGCAGLTSVTIPAGVTEIGDGAFSECIILKSATIPAGVTRIGDSAFMNCVGLKSATVPPGVTEIGDRAFAGCAGLTSVAIPSSVTRIGDEAFIGCAGLTSVTIPAGVTEIGNSAFSWCSSLTSFAVAADNPNYRAENGLLLSKDGRTLIQGVNGVNGRVTIPAGVTEIGDVAFMNCDRLTSVTIPASVARIGEDAFSDCISLTAVTIPAGVTEIGVSAFSFCSGLRAVTIPASVTRIGDYAFEKCTSLRSVTIRAGVAHIGDEVFSDCASLTSVALPASVTEIGWCVFSWCSNLTSLAVAADNPCYRAENGLLLSKDGRTLLQGQGANGRVTLPASVTEIRDFSFEGCSGLTSVTLPAGVAEIGDGAFSGCGNLTSFAVAAGNPDYTSENGLLLSKDGRTLVAGVNGRVTVPAGVTEIGDSAFSGCSGLTSVTLPASVTRIGDRAFCFCGSLTSFAVAADNPNYASRNGLLLSKDGRTLLQGVNGRVTIPAGVTCIGDCAFMGCGGLTSVTIPVGVTEIGGGAFDTCTSLTSVTIPAGVTRIGDYLFSECHGLTSVTISAGVPEIDVSAFDDCPKLRTLVIPMGLTMTNREGESCDDLRGVTVIVNTDDGPLPSEPGEGGPAPSYGPFAPGAAVSIDLPGLVGYAAKGLPAGLRFDAKTGRITGAATKAGVTATVTFTKRGAETYVTQIVVAPFPRLTVEVNDAAGGKVAGAGAYAAGKKITLKATPAKGYVFAGWYADVFGEDESYSYGRPLAGDVDWRTPSFPYVTGAEDATVYARFVPAEDDDWISVFCCMESEIPWDGPGELDFSDILRDESLSLPTARVAGLPAGLKYDAKAMKVTGRPTKPGVYTCALTLSNAAVKNVVETFTIVVPNLESDRIRGLDPDPGAYAFVAGVALDASAPAPRADDGYALKVSGLPAGLKYDAKTGRVAGVPTKPGTYTVTVTGTKRGAPAETATVTVTVEGMPEAVAGALTGHLADGDGAMAGSFAFTATAAGKLTAKVVTTRGAASFSAPSWTRVEEDCCRPDGRTLVAEMADAKTGRTLTLAVDEDGTPDAERCAYADVDGVCAVDAVRNVFSRRWRFAAYGYGDADGEWRLSAVPAAEEADVTVTLKDGTATVAGQLGGVKVGGTTAVRVESDGRLRVRLPAFAAERGRTRLAALDLYEGGGEATLR